MRQDGPQQKQLREALLSAFPTRQDLERMVFDGLGEHLSALTKDDNLEQTVFELVRWAYAQGRHEELIVAAMSQNSGNRELRQVADQLGVKYDQPLSSYPATPALPRIWNIPYPRNPFFTGQEEVLTRLAAALKAGQATALSQPQAISGLGGIGKTQIAVEFAYRHQQEYEAVLWVLADSRESLVSGYIAIAQLLNLPQRDQQYQAVIIQAVKSWLQNHSSWLLILDNADELVMVRDFVPPSFGGHLLLTTRAQSMGRLAKPLEVDTMSQEMGALFLLRRAGLMGEHGALDAASSSDVAQARQISFELGGLPLALDQAGAFIEQSQCGLSDYLSLYRTQRVQMLSRRGGLVDDHREPVATTWSISFERVEQKNPAAADLLRFCAFVSPDAIPEEMIIRGAEHLTSSLQEAVRSPLLFNDAIAALLDYSLIRRNRETKMLSVHRLVQTVLSDAMDEQTRIGWQLQAVLVVNGVCPKVAEVSQWDECEKWLSHALVCAVWVEQEQIRGQEVVHLLNEAGYYLNQRARYAEAEPLYERALAIVEEQLGPTHLDTATSLNNLAMLYEDQGRYERAELLYKRALAIAEEQLGPMHPNTAQSLNNVANFLRNQGGYTEAESLHRRALAIVEEQLGSKHPDTAAHLNNLAALYSAQSKYETAEPLLQRALAIVEEQLGESHPDTASSLNNLALLYAGQGKYESAEPLYERALAIVEEQLGPRHPNTATNLNNLALLYHNQGRYERAEPLFKLALVIREEQLGRAHPHMATSLNNLANLYNQQGKYSDALPLYERALAICEEQLGEAHPDTAGCLHNLAELYRAQGRYTEAEPLLKLALAIWEEQLGPRHPNTASSLSNLAALYRAQGKSSQAEPLYRRALAIREEQLGLMHPDTANSLHNLATLYERQGKYDLAEPIFRRALTIREQALGLSHPSTQRTRRWYVKLLRTLVHCGFDRSMIK